MIKLSYLSRHLATAMALILGFFCVSAKAEITEASLVYALQNHYIQQVETTTRSNADVMNLGHWRKTISSKIYPRFYGGNTGRFNLPEADNLMSAGGARLYTSIQGFPRFDIELSVKDTFFTFEYDNSLILDTNTLSSFSDSEILTLYSNNLLSRSLLVPGFSYRLQNNSEFNFAVVFAQQNYSDINFMSAEISGPAQFDLYSVSYTESREGLGIRLGYEQQLSDKFAITSSFQNKIDMEGFSRLLGVQANPADFDIPAQLDLTMSYQFTKRNKLALTVHEDYYSDINAFVSPSYPRIFLTFLNDLESPEFAWRNLSFYSAALEHAFDNGSRITVEYTGRQQPLPTDSQLATILKAITSDYSIRVGFATQLLGGQFDFYGSYASKPLNFGRTDFGRVNDVLSGAHKEAVVSWTYQF